jgi:hypothetical protein
VNTKPDLGFHIDLVLNVNKVKNILFGSVMGIYNDHAEVTEENYVMKCNEIFDEKLSEILSEIFLEMRNTSRGANTSPGS